MAESNHSEIWKQVIGYEGLYEVSSFGRIRRVGRANGATVGLILRPIFVGTKREYACVSLYAMKKNKRHYVHAIVLEAFCCKRPAGYQCNHKNGLKADNRPENLEWVTCSQNHIHAFRVLKTRSNRGRRHSQFRHDIDEPLVLRLRRTGLSYERIGWEVRASSRTVMAICNGSRVN